LSISPSAPWIAAKSACALARSTAFRYPADLDPRRRMIARAELAAHGFVDPGRDE
jgi:hypothetical protein